MSVADIRSLFEEEERNSEVQVDDHVLTTEVTMSIIGNIGEFDSSCESWESYIERFELFLTCNGIAETKKVCTLLTVVGVKTFNLLRDLCTPEKPSAKTYNELVTIIKEHLYPKPNFIAERYKFSVRNQFEHESVAEYIANLKKLSTHCEFGNNLNDYLRDRLVSGIRNESTKQKLLSEIDLTFDKAITVISSIEAAEKNAASLMGTSSQQHGRVQRMAVKQKTVPAESKVNAVTTNYKQPLHNNNSGKNKVQCKCCGRYGHASKECRFYGCICHHCGKRNHLQKVCYSRLSGKSNTYCNTNSKISNTNNYSKQKQYTNKPKHNYVETDKNVDEAYDISDLFRITENTVNADQEVKVERVKVEPFKVNLTVENKSICFEIDTGASVSVISDKFYYEHFSNLKLIPSDLSLSSHTNVPIEPLGKVIGDVTYQGISKTLQLYVIKNGARPLIGRDWLTVLNVELPTKRNVLYVNNVNSDKPYFEKQANKLFKDFPEVFTDKLGEYKSEPVKLYVKDNCIPRYFKPRALPFTLKAKVEKELTRLVDENVLCPVKSSDWGTPIVPIVKKDGSIRICGDFKVTLNPYLEVDRHPIPRIEDLLNEIQKGEYFSKIDLSQAYMQLKLDSESQKLCTISTHKGLFSYKRMPYGISSAPGIFQRKMEQTLQGLPGVIVFLDDILISAPDNATHVNRLRDVCTRLSNVGFTVKSEKCKLFASKLEFLGFTIDKEGLHTSQSKIKAIIDAPQPKNVTEVKSFIGLINYYGKFVPNLSSVLSPLYNLLKKEVPFVFDRKCVDAFITIKKLLSTAPVLAHYDPTAPTILTVDASSTGVGCVLSILNNEGVEKPVSYSSRTLSPAEVHYSQIDKEALAIVYGVKKYHQYLYGRKFTLRSDHKPLMSIFSPKKGLPLYAASRLQRYALFLSGYNFDIVYVKSDENSADALSRLPLHANHSNENVDMLWVGTHLQSILESSCPIMCDDVRSETKKDHVLNKILGYVLYGWPADIQDHDRDTAMYFQRRDEISVEQGVLLWGYRVIIPVSLRAYLLKELHASHLGVNKMKSVARAYIWWPNLDKDIESLAGSCSSCLLERSNPVKSELHNWQYPSKPWDRLHVDFLGPFKGKMYLIIVDAHSKWLEVFETSSTSAKETVNHLRRLFSCFGLPMSIHSDNGPPFNSFEFKQFLSMNGVKHTTSAPYHPQSNGQAENSVKFAKAKLKCALRDNVDTSVALSRILFDYRNSVHLTTNETPAKLMFGRTLRTRFDLLRPDVTNVVRNKQEKQQMYAGGSKTRLLLPNQPVLIRDYRSKDKWVEGFVVNQFSPTMYIVKLNSGLLWRRHIDQLISVDSSPALKAERNVADDVLLPVRNPPAVPPSVRPQADVDVTTPSSPAVARARTSFSPEPVDCSVSPLRPSPQMRRSFSPLAHRTSLTPVKSNSAGGGRYPQRDRKPVDRMNL